MDILQLTAHNFDDAVSNADCLVVEFSSDAADFLQRAALVTQEGVTWGHVDPKAHPRLAASFGLASDTALLVFRDQVVLYLEEGRHEPAIISDLLRQIVALDMRQVKSEIEAEKQAELALRMRRVCPTARRGPM